MAKLKQIIGGILSDISRARAISDAYSRDLKSYYREDPFLKLLSVPRTDIKEVTIDLKFSINELEYDTAPTLHIDYKDQGVTAQNVNQIEFGTEEGQVLGMYRRIGMKTWVEEHLWEGTPKVISQLNEIGQDEWSINLDNGSFEDPSLFKSISLNLNTQEIFVRGIEGNEPEQYNILSASADLPSKLGVEPDLETIEVEVVASQLANMPEATLSSISVKLDLTSV